MIPNETHFQQFKDRCKYWIDQFGLHGWDIYFKFEDECESRASYSLYPDARQVTFSYYKTDRKYIENEDDMIHDINTCAFHEVVHVFLNKLEFISQWFPNDNTLQEAEEHNIIFTLQKLINK